MQLKAYEEDLEEARYREGLQQQELDALQRQNQQLGHEVENLEERLQLLEQDKAGLVDDLHAARQLSTTVGRSRDEMERRCATMLAELEEVGWGGGGGLRIPLTVSFLSLPRPPPPFPHS